jgi:hypothetical protein
MKWLKYLSVALICAAIAACSHDKEPAEQALKSATEAVENARAEDSKFAGEQFKALENQLKAAKDRFDRKEYPEALQAASGVAAKAREVLKAAADKKAELTKAWQELESGFAQMMEAVKGRLDTLSAAKKSPKDMDEDKLAGPHSALDEAGKAFEEAKSAAACGDFAEVIESGKAIKARIEEMLAVLGLQRR